MNENNKNIHIVSGAFKRKSKQLKEEKNEKLIKSNKKIDCFSNLPELKAKPQANKF